MTKHTWESIYQAGEQLNRYPYDFIVSSFFRYRPRPADDRPLRVLDLGCGAGNHALFFAENGAEVLAVDYSTAALDVVAKRAQAAGLGQQVETRQVDFEHFDLADMRFDIAIDRLAVSHVSRRHASTIYNAVHELLNPGGVLFSNLFSTRHSHMDYGEYDIHLDIWHKFSEGIFEHLHSAYFYSEQDVRELLSAYKLLSLTLDTEEDLLSQEVKQVWNIIAKKT